MTNVDEVIGSLEQLKNDPEVPQSVEETLNELIEEFQNREGELSLVINKAQNELEDLSEDVNIPQFVRTQIWSILSQLAALESELIEA